MDQRSNNLISFVVPVHNESLGLEAFNASLIDIASGLGRPFEVLYVDDGSTDDTANLVRSLQSNKSDIKLVKLSRNFGKEAALTAGIAEAKGEAIITLDGDGQHPVGRIPDFIDEWNKGAQVVVGIRSNPSGKEERHAGEASYSTRQLLKLGINRLVSSSPRPLYMFGYLGILISAFSFILGAAIVIEQLVLEDPLGWDFTGTAMLGVLILFLVGIVLMSQGILSLYISHIHTQSKQRPLYIIDDTDSE